MLSKNAPPQIACVWGRYDGGKVKLVAGAQTTSDAGIPFENRGGS